MQIYGRFVSHQKSQSKSYLEVTHLSCSDFAFWEHSAAGQHITKQALHVRFWLLKWAMRDKIKGKREPGRKPIGMAFVKVIATL
jgi:hypothetical protein